MLSYYFWQFSPCSLHRRARRNGTQMQCPHTPYREAPYHQSLDEAHMHHYHHHHYRETHNNNCVVTIEGNRKEGCKMVLTGECACESTGPFCHRGMAVGCWWYRCYLGNGSIVYFRKLKDHSWGRISSPLLPSLLQGSNFLKGDALWRWRLRVWQGWLGLVSTGRTARTWAGTPCRTSVQDNTTWKKRGLQNSSQIVSVVNTKIYVCEWTFKCWAMFTQNHQVCMVTIVI